MFKYYVDGKQAASKGIKTAWLTAGAPVEPVVAMGILPIYPENHAAFCGSRKVSLELCEIAEAEGYSQDLCSYARVDIGSALSGKSPAGRLPKPDMLVCCSNQCGTVVKWYEALARLFKVPLLLVDTPFGNQRSTEAKRENVNWQFKQMILRMVSATYTYGWSTNRFGGAEEDKVVGRGFASRNG